MTYGQFHFFLIQADCVFLEGSYWLISFMEILIFCWKAKVDFILTDFLFISFEFLGSGKTKKLAKKEAAEHLLEILSAKEADSVVWILWKLVCVMLFWISRILIHVYILIFESVKHFKFLNLVPFMICLRNEFLRFVMFYFLITFSCCIVFS